MHYVGKKCVAPILFGFTNEFFDRGVLGIRVGKFHCRRRGNRLIF